MQLLEDCQNVVDWDVIYHVLCTCRKQWSRKYQMWYYAHVIVTELMSTRARSVNIIGNLIITNLSKALSLYIDNLSRLKHIHASLLLRLSSTKSTQSVGHPEHVAIRIVAIIRSTSVIRNTLVIRSTSVIRSTLAIY